MFHLFLYSSLALNIMLLPKFKTHSSWRSWNLVRYLPKRSNWNHLSVAFASVELVHVLRFVACASAAMHVVASFSSPTWSTSWVSSILFLFSKFNNKLCTRLLLTCFSKIWRSIFEDDGRKDALLLTCLHEEPNMISVINIFLKFIPQNQILP